MPFPSDVISDLTGIISDWGDSAVITHGGVPVAVAGVYESEYVDIDLISGVVQSSRPAFWCKTTDAPNANNSDTLVVTSVLFNITAVAYKTHNVQKNPPDLGPGTTRFVLKL
jgi:hypothetical protein